MDYLVVHDSYDIAWRRHPLFKWAKPFAYSGINIRDLFYLELEEAIKKRAQEDPVEAFNKAMDTMVPEESKKTLKDLKGQLIFTEIQDSKIKKIM